MSSWTWNSWKRQSPSQTHLFRTGTWSGMGVNGVLGQGYASPGVPKRIMNSLGSLGHSASSNSVSSPSNKTPVLTSNCGTIRSNISHHSAGTPRRVFLQPGATIKTQNPRPTKARATFDSLVLALQSVVQNVEEELDGLKSSVNEHSQEIKSSERYLKKLEYHLSLIEELSEQYGLQQKLREGVRAMAMAYAISNGRDKEVALTNVKAGFRECSETLCSLEAQLETLLGCFKMEIKGIQGFSRLVPGDVFEITIKHGIQKWKTKGKVSKDGSQVWDYPLATFHGMLGDQIHIKAAELKTLGKQILLGNKFCEITELFSSHPQLMTVNLNPTGSLKLSLLINWRPIETVEDYYPTNLCYSQSNGSLRSSTASTPSTLSPSRKRRISHLDVSPEGSTCGAVESQSILDFSVQTTKSCSNQNENIQTPLPVPLSSSTPNAVPAANENNQSSEHRVSALWERSLADPETCINKLSTNLPSSPATSTMMHLYDPSGNFRLAKKEIGKSTSSFRPRTFSELKEEETMESGCSAISSLESLNLNDEMMTDGRSKILKNSVLKLSSLLEDIQGQFPELESLESHLSTLESLISKPLSSSNTSLNIESALECFDFLDDVNEDSPNSNKEKSPEQVIHDHENEIEPEILSSNNNPSSNSPTDAYCCRNEILDPKLSTRTTDSGISSLVHEHGSPSPRNLSPVEVPITGNGILDTVLEAHVFTCLQLIHNLGSFGPLKYREKVALQKLQQQSILIGNIISRIHKGTRSGSCPDILRTLQFSELWERILGHIGHSDQQLLIPISQILIGLEKEVCGYLSTEQLKSNPKLGSRVSKRIISRMLNDSINTVNVTTHTEVLTVFQFELFLKHEQCFPNIVEELVEEEILKEKLLDETKLESALKEFPTTSLPSKSIIHTLLKLLSHENLESQSSRVIRQFISKICSSSTNTEREVLEIAVEMLEGTESDRISACRVFETLSSQDYMPELAYIAQVDESAQVRQSARDTLHALGPEGQTILAQLTLSTNGFQGL